MRRYEGDGALYDEEEEAPRPQLSPGKRTLTSRIPQAEPDSDASRATGEVAARAGGGQSLGAGPAQLFGRAYGADFGSVRIHTDSAAADAAGAEAFTYGNDIFFGAGRYQPDTNHGAFVLGHELAHVAQQGSEPAPQPRLSDEGAQQALEVGTDADPAEAEASNAARTAMRGGSVSISRSPARVRFFKQATGDKADGGHAYMTEQALLGMGVGGPQAARTARQGNWMRDLSQAMIPTTRPLTQPIFGILNILSIKDFHRGFAWEELGTYDPVEHIDNPALLRGDGAYAQGAMPKVGDDSDIHQSEVIAEHDRDGNVTGHHYAHDAGSEHQAYADIDDRYGRTNLDHGAVMNPGDAAAFQVDESGIPRYMHTSKHLLKVQLKNAARLGRSGNDGRGPRQFASAVHIMQDFYAHSNFCEVALNILIRQGTLRVREANGHMKTLSRDAVLDTRMHANDSHGNPGQANLTRTVGQGRNRRVIETMTTGSFTPTDTAASILEEVSDRWKQFNPFKPGSREASELTGAALDYLEMNSPSDFGALSGEVAQIIRDLKPTVEALAPTAANVVEGAGNIGGSAVEHAGEAASWGLGLLNQANAALGGDADYFDSERRAVESTSHRVAGNVRDAGAEGARGIRNVVTQLDDFAASIAKEKSILRRAYDWAYKNINPLQWAADAAKHIPVIGDRASKLILTAGNQIKAAAEEKLGALWNEVIDDGVDKINAVIGAVRAHTNMQDQRRAGRGSGIQAWAERKAGGVGDMYDDNGHPTNGIAPDSYSVPSHTEIGKDHADVTQGARDQQADSSHDPVSHHEEESGADSSHGGADEHGHVHGGAFLANVAETLASMATRACATPVSNAWDAVASAHDPSAAAQYDDDIERAVNLYFAHPSSSSYWVGPMRAAAGSTLGPDIIAHLDAARAGTPAQGEVFAGPGDDRNASADDDEHPEYTD